MQHSWAILGLERNRNMHLVFDSLLFPNIPQPFWSGSFGFYHCLPWKPSDIWYSADFRAHLPHCGKYMQKKRIPWVWAGGRFLFTNPVWGVQTFVSALTWAMENSSCKLMSQPIASGPYHMGFKWEKLWPPPNTLPRALPNISPHDPFL